MQKNRSKKFKHIETAKHAALEVLKPSKKNLEHGLKLHKEIIVIENLL